MIENKKNIQKIKKPWPTKDAMEQVYQMKLWGGDKTSKFYSGEGSHLLAITDPYIKAVAKFLTSFENPISVCDLGCGDFNIGKRLIKHTKNYIAVDIVPKLIEYNKVTFKSDNLEFYSLDISKDHLPKADCALLRQVLQHLSNAEIQRVIEKLYSFKYVILTEHIPAGDFIPNKDIISGQGTRLKKLSGIDLLEVPFNLKIKQQQKLVSVDLGGEKGIIKTTLYQFF